MDLVARSYPGRVVAPRAQLLLQELFPSRDRGVDPGQDLGY